MPRRTDEMPKRIVSELTEEQEAALAFYQDKWRSVALLTEPIDPEKVVAVIKAAYAASDFPEPEILFYSNPLIAIQQILAIENFREYTGRIIRSKFSKRVFDHLLKTMKRQLDEKLFITLRNKSLYSEFPHYWTESNPIVSAFPLNVERCTESQLFADLAKPEFEFTNICNFLLTLSRPAGWASWGCMFDFCISVLELQHDKQKWKVLQELIQNSGFIFLFEKICVACDRPSKLSFDQQNMLHAEEEPALQFPDGYSVYARHGIHPSKEQCCEESDCD